MQLQKIGIHWELATGTAGLECIFFRGAKLSGFMENIFRRSFLVLTVCSNSVEVEEDGKRGGVTQSKARLAMSLCPL